MALQLELKSYEGVLCVNRTGHNEHHQLHELVEAMEQELEEEL